jgi:sigma-B regulation protein RsbU (phosphoserine phosphatase)
MGMVKTRALRQQEPTPGVEACVSIGEPEFDAVVESLTRLSEVRHRHPTLELLMNNVPFGVLLLDAELKLLSSNKACKDFLDPSAGTSLGTPLKVLLPNADDCGITRLLLRALDRGRAVRAKNFRYDGFGKGTTYWNGSAIPVRLLSADGPYDAVAMVVLEVTDEILAREQLANFAILAEQRATEIEIERARLKAVIEAVPVPMVVCNAEGRITAINSAMSKLYAPSECGDQVYVGRSVDRMLPGVMYNDDGTQMATDRCPVRRSLDGEECRNVVVHCQPSVPDQRRIFTLSSAPLMDGTGRITGAVAAMSDITQQRLVFEQLEESYQREHAIATKLQESFLACDLPDMKGFEYEKVYRPARNASMVGGDFLDVFKVGNHKYAIVMADVAGKGLKSAVYTAMTKYMLRAYALEQCCPKLTLARLNDALAACTPFEVFVTLAYGILDTQERTFTYGNAGHEEPLLLRAGNQTVTKLKVTGSALTLIPGAAYASHCVQLFPGDVILLYTDGITDAGSGTDRLGQERLMELLQSYDNATAAEFVERVINAAGEFAGGVLADDAALLAIRAL